MKSVLLPKPDVYSFKESLWFLDRGFDDCLHQVTPNSVIKAIRFQDEVLLCEVSETKDKIKIDLLHETTSPTVAEGLEDFVTRWLDLDRDITPFYKKALNNKYVKPITQKYHGLRLITIPDLFEALCWCVIGQQINLTFAHKMKTAMVHKYGEYATYDSVRHHVFPKPESLSRLSIEDLKALQFSRQKADYVITIARLFEEKSVDIEALNDYSSTREMISELCKIRGVGEWTANYVAMKTFRRMDCITYGDAGLLNGIKAICELEKKPDRAALDDFFKGFDNWQSYLVFYIWRTLA